MGELPKSPRFALLGSFRLVPVPVKGVSDIIVTWFLPPHRVTRMELLALQIQEAFVFIIHNTIVWNYTPIELGVVWVVINIGCFVHIPTRSSLLHIMYKLVCLQRVHHLSKVSPVTLH